MIIICLLVITLICPLSTYKSIRQTLFKFKKNVTQITLFIFIIDLKMIKKTND